MGVRVYVVFPAEMWEWSTDVSKWTATDQNREQKVWSVS